MDGEHSDIAETSCGTSVMAVGSTVYELSGDGDLGTRSLEAVDMSAGDECSITGVPSTAECYRYISWLFFFFVRLFSIQCCVVAVLRESAGSSGLIV